MAHWTADVRWSGQEASWLVDWFRDGDRVWLTDRKGRPVVRAFMRRRRAERVAFRSLEHAQRHDRLPHRGGQHAHGERSGQRWDA